MSDALRWIQKLQSIAQSGAAYSKDPFDQERFVEVQTIAIQMLAQLHHLTPQHANDLFFEDTGYRTPKIDVRGAVFDSGKVLLVKERSDGLWTLPGGWVDIGESPRQAVEREVTEETGLTVSALKLAAIHDINIHQPGQFYHAHKLFFICERISGELESTQEISESQFFSEESLPPLSLQRTTASQISLIFEHYRRRDLPTAFD